jgi:hypothetical protein
MAINAPADLHNTLLSSATEILDGPPNEAFLRLQDMPLGQNVSFRCWTLSRIRA